MSRTRSSHSGQMSREEAALRRKRRQKKQKQKRIIRNILIGAVFFYTLSVGATFFFTRAYYQKKNPVPASSASSGQTDPDQQESNLPESQSQSGQEDQSESRSDETANISSDGISLSTFSASKDDWKLVLVNENNPISEDTTVTTKFLANGIYEVDERIYDDLMNMLNDAEARGLSLLVCSGYRSYEKQTELFDEQVQTEITNGNLDQEDAAAIAKTKTAIPGTSEHNLGLAVDIVAAAYQILDAKQQDTPEVKWLLENCHKYGFVLRYPSDKSEITGIIYEPWHYRYVGVEAATYMYENNLCLEEFLDML